MNPGDILGNYRIDRLLGEGGMGAVYQVYDLSLQRDVAIKLIHPHFARQPNFRERFLQEARVMARLDHPGIVKVHTISVDGDTVYIVMEYISGGNLRQFLDNLLQKRKWLPMKEAVILVQQLCRTLEYAHQHKVLHRDIKPANLMLKIEPAEGLPFRVVLTDLGLAKLLEGQGITMEGTSLGTPAYMSPEQASGQKTDPRSDVYSLGILLYELTVGRLPFPIRTITEAVRYHTREQPPPPRSIRPDLPEALERIILKALEKDPGKRYSSAAELETALAGMNTPATQIYQSTVGPNISLATVHQESILAPQKPATASPMTVFDAGSTTARGASVFGNQLPPESAQTRIQVTSKGKNPQVFNLLGETVTIGRDKENQIAIEDTEISRRHVEITWDGSNYYLTDLKSTNGTFLGNTRLLPGVPEVWDPNLLVRIGDSWLRLLRPALDSQRENQNGSRFTNINLFTSAGAGLVGVTVTPQQLTVEAGASVSANISLFNQSSIVDHFTLSLTGIPSAWIANLPSRVELMPGERKETSFSLRIPRASTSRAGPHQLTLKVSSQNDPGQFVEHKLTLTIAAYSQFRAELQPQRLRAGQSGRLTVTNQGNIQETFNIQFTDAAEELAFQPPQLQLRVPEGQAATAEFQARLRQPRWLGGEKSHAFSAQVSQPKGEPQTLHAELLSHGWLPAWVPIVIIPLCLLLAAGLMTMPALLFPAPTQTLTPALTETGTATATPEPGAPVVEEWCVYPSDQPPASFIDCPIQVKALLGTTLVIQWRLSNAEEVVIEPIGNQPSTGKLSYEVTQNTTAINLKASNAGKTIQKSAQIIVELPTSTPTATTTLTATLTSTPSPTQTATTTLTPSPTSTFTPTSTATTQPSTSTRISFEAFPNGDPVTTSRILGGDEFLSKGIRLAGAPESSYCADATVAAILLPNSYNIPFHFLSTSSPGEINRCNAIPVAINFVNPVSEVTLTFTGASVTYTMKAYNSGGGLLGTVQQVAVLGGTFNITFASGSSNIARVTFGKETAVTAIKEINYKP
jgi:serine/threonine protein kinase